MAMLMYKGVATMRTVRNVNIALFVLCVVLSGWLSSFGKPLNGVTIWFMDKAYSVFGSMLSEPYEADADPIRFTAIIVAVLIYAIVMFVILRLLFRKFQANR
jgi:hypothetical protein